MPAITSRLEISLTKVLAESNNLKPFSKVVIEKIHPESATLDFVELAFKRQYLQRGNFFRFQNEMINRPIYLNQNLTINGIQAQIQELRKDFDTKRSGIISDRTKFVFRSRSARIIWLVQISAEMWEFDQVSVEVERENHHLCAHTVSVLLFTLHRMEICTSRNFCETLSVRCWTSGGTWACRTC
jgi:hypothetical protein